MQVVHVLMWLLSTCCFAFGLPFVFMNWHTVFAWIVLGKHSSWVPGLGGIFVGIGIATLPLPAVRPYWWICLLLDWGCAPGIVYSIAYVAYCYLSGRKL